MRVSNTPLKVRLDIEHWPLLEPLKIHGYTFETVEAIVVTLACNGCTGQGEAAGIYYRRESGASMRAQIEAVLPRIGSNISHQSIRESLPPGGARNALDCALWDLQAQCTGCSVWQLTGLPEPQPLVTTFTCGADDPQKMAATARSYKNARAIKLKLTGEPVDAERVRAVREARPEVWLGVDANQGFTRELLENLMSELLACGVELIEQPFPVGREALLDGLSSPIPIAADESLQALEDLPRLANRFQVANIKLDKCGGLTEGLEMARAAHLHGLTPMVGNMPGSSLSMAPAFLLGQLCNIVDLDGAIFLAADRAEHVRYDDGLVWCPPEVWGGAKNRQRNEQG